MLARTIALAAGGLALVGVAIEFALSRVSELPEEQAGCGDCNELRCTQANFESCNRRLCSIRTGGAL